MSYFVVLALGTNSLQSWSGHALASACVSSPQPRDSLEELDTLSSQACRRHDLPYCRISPVPAISWDVYDHTYFVLRSNPWSWHWTEWRHYGKRQWAWCNWQLYSKRCRKDRTEMISYSLKWITMTSACLKGLKFYLTHKLPICEIDNVWYVVRGRKVWFHTDTDTEQHHLCSETS